MRSFTICTASTLLWILLGRSHQVAWGGQGSQHAWVTKNANMFPVWKNDQKRPHPRIKRKWKNNIKLERRRIGWESGKTCCLKRQEGGQNCTMRNSMTNTRHGMQSGLSKEEGIGGGFVIIKYWIYIDIQSEYNYVILSGIIQRINYMFRPLFGHHQVVLSLQSNCIT
jgi:hypothetical protein